MGIAGWHGRRLGVRGRAAAAIAVACLGVSTLGQPAALADDDNLKKTEQHNLVLLKNSATPVPGLWEARLRRSAEDIKLDLKTRIEPGHAATVWWIVFNDPSRCVHGPVAAGLPQVCGNDDRSADHVSVLYAGGSVAKNDGEFKVKGKLKVGDLKDVAMGPGLIDPWRAEVHAVVRTHGMASADPDMRESQVSTMDGGCPVSELPDTHHLRGIPGDGTCSSIQWTFFTGVVTPVVGVDVDLDDDDDADD